mgnify:CR=1 FL=1
MVFFDPPDEIVAERMARRELDRFEAAGADFHARVLDGFRTLANAEPDRWITITASGSISEVARTIDEANERRLVERAVS